MLVLGKPRLCFRFQSQQPAPSGPGGSLQWTRSHHRLRQLCGLFGSSGDHVQWVLTVLTDHHTVPSSWWWWRLFLLHRYVRHAGRRELRNHRARHTEGTDNMETSAVLLFWIQLDLIRSSCWDQIWFDHQTRPQDQTCLQNNIQLSTQKHPEMEQS